MDDAMTLESSDDINELIETLSGVGVWMCTYHSTHENVIAVIGVVNEATQVDTLILCVVNWN